MITISSKWYLYACKPIYRSIFSISSNYPLSCVLSCTQFVSERKLEPSIHSLNRLSCSGSWEAGTVPSTHWARGGVQPGQVARLSHIHTYGQFRWKTYRHRVHPQRKGPVGQWILTQYFLLWGVRAEWMTRPFSMQIWSNSQDVTDGCWVLIIPLMMAQSYDMTHSTVSSSHGAEQSADRKAPYARYQSH